MGKKAGRGGRWRLGGVRKTHNTAMPIHAFNPPVRVWHQQLRGYELLHGKDDTARDPDANRRSTIFDCLASIFDLEPHAQTTHCQVPLLSWETMPEPTGLGGISFGERKVPYLKVTSVRGKDAVAEIVARSD